MNILILPSWYPTEDSPNSGSYNREQAIAQARYGHDVRVLVIRSSTDGKTTWEKKQLENIMEYYLYVKQIPYHLTGLLVMKEIIHLFRTEFRSHKIDVVQVNSYRCGRYARFIQTLYRIPYLVWEVYSGFQRGTVQGRDLEQAKGVFAHAAVVATDSPGLKEAIAHLCPTEIEVVPCMVSDRFFAGRLHDGPTDGIFRFVSIGYMNHNKAFDVLLRAFAEVHRQEPHTTLTLIGPGDREPFEKLAEELGISQAVIFTGLIPREEVAEQLRRSQVFSLLSRVETFGISNVEAMACGLPIVMTKTDGYPLIITPQTGIGVEIDDDKGAAEAMLHILRHYDEYDAKTISQYCRDNFSEEAVSRRLTELGERMLQK